jgi:hypothetical protein
MVMDGFELESDLADGRESGLGLAEIAMAESDVLLVESTALLRPDWFLLLCIDRYESR